MKRVLRIIFKIFIILCFIVVAFSVGVKIWLHDPEKFQGSHEEQWAERERLTKAVNEKHSRLPSRFELEPSFKQIIGSASMAKSMKSKYEFVSDKNLSKYDPYLRAEIEQDTLVIVKTDDGFYLDSHGKKPLYLVEDYDLSHFHEEYELNQNKKFTTFVSLDGSYFIYIHHDDCDDDSNFVQCAQPFFRAYNLSEGTYLTSLIRFFPPRPKHWREGKSLLGYFNHIYEYLEEEH